MSDSAAVLFALSMVVWVADVRFAPKPAVAVACESGPNATPPADADVEVVICGARSK